MKQLPRHLVVPLVLVLASAVLVGCSRDPGTSASFPETATPTMSAAASPERDTEVGITVTGNVGDKPAVTVPASEAPEDLVVEVLVPGKGPKVVSGQYLITDYLGQTWRPRDGKATIFDNTYDTGKVFGSLIGTGGMIPGWDSGLVGQRVGSRVLLVIPPDLGYGTATDENDLAGQTLVFVVDIIAAVGRDAAADGTPTGPLPDGMPAVTSESGKRPAITSVHGVEPGKKVRSELLLAGNGAELREDTMLLLQIVGVDTAEGASVEQTWGIHPELVSAAEVFSVLPALKGRKVGSRAVAVTPGTAESPSMVIVVDVIGQY